MTLRRRLGRASLRSRLSWSASLVVALWVVLLAVGANLLLARGLAAQADDVLRTRAEATAQTVQVAADGRVTLLEAREDRALDIGTWVIDGTGTIVERPPGSTPSLDAAATDLVRSGAETRELGDGDPLRLLSLPITEHGRQVATVVTSTSLSPYRQVQRLAVLGSIGVAVLFMVVVHLVLRANVARALRPVQQMGAQAGEWSADDVEHRFGAEPRPAELAELAGTLNRLLDRVSAVLRHEQRFSEELSHELRTPLARIQAEIDLVTAQSRTADEVRRAHLAIGRAAGAMRSILDTMMTAARTAGASAAGRTRMDEVLPELADPTGSAPGTAVVVDCPPDLVVGVDADVVVRALAPVVDNALRYARTRVVLRARAEQGQVTVTVEDDGPGMTAEVAARAFEPGFRGDPGDGASGAGLGLALTRRLVGAAGGTVEAAASASGGRVAVHLPHG